MFQLQFDLSCEIRENKLIPVFSDIETVSVYILMQMFPLMRTFAIIGILLVNVYSTRKYSVKVGNKTGNLGTRKYLVEVGNERSEEDEDSGDYEEDEYDYQSYAEMLWNDEEEKKEYELREAEYMEYRKKEDEKDKNYGYEWMKG